jgi:hypothetical protein
MTIWSIRKRFFSIGGRRRKRRSKGTRRWSRGRRRSRRRRKSRNRSIIEVPYCL